MLADSHCHLDRLDLTPFDNQFDKAIEAANQKGVEHFLCVAINAENQKEVIKIAESHPNIHASVGIHPLYTKRARGGERLQIPQQVLDPALHLL